MGAKKKKPHGMPIEVWELKKKRSAEYAEKLKDPKWFKRRKEIITRDQHKCVNCRHTQTLQVHHIKYLPDRYPWEYDNDYLITLCRACHVDAHRKKKSRLSKKFKSDLRGIKKKLKAGEKVKVEFKVVVTPQIPPPFIFENIKPTTYSERIIKSILKELKIRFVFKHSISYKGMKIIASFFIPTQKLVITVRNIDSEYLVRRNKWLEDLGYHILNIDNNMADTMTYDKLELLINKLKLDYESYVDPFAGKRAADIRKKHKAALKRSKRGSKVKRWRK